MSIKCTFWQLLDLHSICIPIIQRDYAQGRIDSKSSQIRTEFIATLFTMVSDIEKSQDLDFIYGSVKDADLILLDGQQRITTLFLLHWYIAAGSGHLAEASKKLSKFKYENRITSKEFTNSLLQFGSELNIHKINGSLSETICDAGWFFSVWEHDPTIRAMLVVLDEMHNVFRDSLSSCLWQRLICTEKPPITFHFLNMDNFALTDELYIKMNARGQALTDFENFKAWLQGYVNRSDDIDLKDDFWLKLDKSWTDIFWKMRPENVNEVDNVYQAFFKTIALTEFGLIIENKKNSVKEFSNIVNDLRNNSYFGHTMYEELACFSGASLNNTHRFLDFIHKVLFHFDWSNEFSAKEKILEVFNNGIRENGYLEKVRFASLYTFISENKSFDSLSPLSQNELDNLSHWLGVSERLINNSTFDSATDYVNAVKSLCSLAKHLNSRVFPNLSNLESKDISFFNDRQKNEEVLKAQLILENHEWLAAFDTYHEHYYFYGQVGFLLDSCKNENLYCLDKFKTNAQKSSVLFSKETLNRKDFLLHRALLTFGDYLVWQGRNKSFCRNSRSNARDRNENWRSVFNDKENRQKILFQLINALDVGNELEGMTLLVKSSSISDWRKCVIDEPDILKECKRMCARFNYEGSEIYLLCSSRMSGYHYGLYSYYTFLKLSKINLDTDHPMSSLLEGLECYDYVTGSSEVPSINFKYKGDSNLYFYLSDKFTYELWQGDEELEFDESHSMKALTKFAYQITGLSELSEQLEPSDELE
ncbi:hypothetical protein VHA01S_019_00600 [Vibrio halioticoli NBRC 102217]|uniref:GmrSD restriction endonucleases N-terminal domain-containing protein n=1 Tax=Vibrio halioticoli NBRC 102217 TaxID=1219072 RepID=V5FCY6_9VIBR|nr:DUF262 domain-containing protein [Vibrio halioticoli]GAD89383.1 hypothetical protein VHA01S_019_00600 [Vibrio halioticoli NBRC 102217]